MLRRLWLSIALTLACAGAQPSFAQETTPAGAPPQVSLAAAAAAVESGDPEALRAVSADEALIGALRNSDPDTLIELQLSLAAAYAEAGLKGEAIASYEQALTSILAFRGQGHPSMIEPLEAVAALSDAPEDKAAWLLAAFDIREVILGVGNPQLLPYREALDAARARVDLDPIGTRGQIPQTGEANFDLIDVYYATHRVGRAGAAPDAMFGGRRGDLNFGVAQVSVPRDRAPGEIPTPSIWSFEFRADPNKHMVLNRVTPITDRTSFFRRVSEVVDKTERREVFVFIHGYNTSFEGAAIRTAQLAVDMNLDGAPILYSWPSRAHLLGYGADAEAVADRVLVADVAEFLTDVAERTGAERVHLVAHSMGNRVLIRALQQIAYDRATPVAYPVQEPLFDEVVLAAPDVGVDEFEATWPHIVDQGRRFTLYASQRDRALQVSEMVNQMRRVGDARTVVVREGLQTVDTTAASAGLLGHDDFAGSALTDFRAVMWLSLAPERRCVLETAEAPEGRYWAFGEGCPENEFGEDVELVRAEGTVEGALAKLNQDLAQATADVRESLMKKRDRLAQIFGLSPQGQSVGQPAATPAGAH